jgi:hypothetical protein
MKARAESRGFFILSADYPDEIEKEKALEQ